MAHVEPMDIDSLESDYEDKENSILHSNVLTRTPCTEKGYEELDISELNMKLRYSITPASSPMSRSFTANSKDHKNIEDKNSSVASDNLCLTSSFNSTLTSDSHKTNKVCPLQTLPTDPLADTNRNVLGCRSLDNGLDNNITITVSDNIDENYSIPSTSSSLPHTPEATTPTKDLPKDGGSPIMRGLRSVLSIFRPSQSPIPSNEQPSLGDVTLLQSNNFITDDNHSDPIEVSTPLQKTNRCSPKRNSPLKDSLVFKDDLEKELQWKDESTILFKEEKIPKHKLLLQETIASSLESKLLCKTKEGQNKTLEYMDISYNDSILNDKTMAVVETNAISSIEASALESDSEFVDCETTYNKVEIESHNVTDGLDLELNKSKEIDQKNGALQEFINVENNCSFNSSAPKVSLTTSYIGKENDVDLKISMLKEILPVDTCNKDTLQFNNSCKIINDSLTSIQDKSLLVTDASNGKELQEMSEVTINKINIDIVNDDTNMTDNDIVKVCLLENTVHSKQNNIELVDKELVIKCDDNSIVISNIVDNSLLVENNIQINSNYLNHGDIIKTEPDVIKDSTCIDDTNIENNFTAEMCKDLVENNVETYNSNNTIELLNKPDQFDLDMNFLDDKIGLSDNDLVTTETILSNRSNNLSLNDDNQIHILNTDVNNMLNNNPNAIDNSSVCDHENKKIIYNENRCFQTTIEMEIPLLEYLNNSKESINQGQHTSFSDKVLDSSNSCSASLSEMSIIKQIEPILENTVCPHNLVEKCDQINDTEILFEKNGIVDIVTTNQKQFEELPTHIPLPSDNEHEAKKFEFEFQNSKQILELPTHIPLDNEQEAKNFEFKNSKQLFELPTHTLLPSDNEQELKNVKFELKTDSQNYRNDENSVVFCTTKIIEKTPNIFSTTPLEEDILIDQKSEVMKSESRDEDIDMLKEDLIICSKFNQNNTFDSNINKCDELEKAITNKSVMINSSSFSLNHDLKLDENQIVSDEVQSLKIIDNNEVIGQSDQSEKDISLENYRTGKLTSHMKEDPVVFPIEEVLNPLETKTNTQMSPPLSPLTSKKGYDINFDNIDDPFATKTKIRQSPTPESPTKILSSSKIDSHSEKSVFTPKRITPKSKRKTQHSRKSGSAKNNVLNATYINNVDNNDIVTKSGTNKEILKTSTPIADCSANTESTISIKSDIDKEDLNNTNDSVKNKRVNVSLDFAESSSVRDMTKNVFNCPEINDVKFRSFSGIQKSILPHLQASNTDLTIDTHEVIENSLTLKTGGIESDHSGIDIQSEIKSENKLAPYLSNETFQSRNSGSDATREVNTEDEDTATFIEMEELIEQGNQDDFNKEKHVMEFQIPHTAIDSENIDNGELFIDAEAFEFLLNQNKSNIIAESGKESLFLKFDPLFAKRVSSDGIIAALKKVQNKQSTPKKLTKLQLDEALNIAGPSNLETTFDEANDDGNIQGVSKPMMVVNPAVSAIVSPRKVITPKINRQSLTFTSPAMAVIDRLLSLSGNNSDVDQNTSLPTRQPSETDLAISQLREMLADKDIHVHNLKSESKDLKDRLSSLEAQVKTLETESADRLRKINDLSETLVEKTKINKSMAIVVEEYERTIASLITQMEQEKKNNSEERLMLIKERDEQTAHLASMEVSFSDLHSKYEKSKQIIYSMKSNEDTYRKSIQEFEESLVKMQNNYELLKQHATSKLNHANQELEKYNRAHEAEVLKLNALIKRKELHITSLEETLAQKTKANEELTAICDELINKVG